MCRRSGLDALFAVYMWEGRSLSYPGVPPSSSSLSRYLSPHFHTCSACQEKVQEQTDPRFTNYQLIKIFGSTKRLSPGRLHALTPATTTNEKRGRNAHNARHTIRHCRVLPNEGPPPRRDCDRHFQFRRLGFPERWRHSRYCCWFHSRLHPPHLGHLVLHAARRPAQPRRNGRGGLLSRPPWVILASPPPPPPETPQAASQAGG